MNGVSIRRNSLSQQPQFFLPIPLGTFGSYPVAFQNSQAYCRDPECRNDQCDPPEERHRGKTFCEDIHEVGWQSAIGCGKNTVQASCSEDYEGLKDNPSQSRAQRSRRRESRQTQTLERGASLSSTDVKHNDQFENRDVGQFNSIFFDLVCCVRGTKIPLLAHDFSKRGPPSGDQRNTNSWVRSVSVSSKTSAMRLSPCG